MFVLCKDVKIYNHETHYHCDQHSKMVPKSRKRQIEVINSKSRPSTPFRAKGIVVSRNLDLDQKIEPLGRRNLLDSLSRRETMMHNTTTSKSRRKCIHSIESKSQRGMLGNSLDNKKTTRFRVTEDEVQK